MNSKKLERWHKEVLSGYQQAKENGSIGAHDLETKRNGKTKRIRVPIVNPDNIGPYMNIDEKHIKQEYYTILSNPETGKIALMVEATKAELITEAGRKLGDKRFIVKDIARDMAQNMEWACRQLFMNAQHTVDKFHVIQLLTNSIQAVRIRYRQELLRDKRERREQHRLNEKERRAECNKYGQPFKPKPFKYDERVFDNGDTLSQLLARSRYLLFKLPGQWIESQQERADILFKQYPDLAKAHALMCAFRSWMAKDQIGKNTNAKKKQLTQWLEKVDKSSIDELIDFASTVKHHLAQILHYFEKGRTNASAEALNNNIQRFINASYGIRDLDFFLYRINTHFA